MTNGDPDTPYESPVDFVRAERHAGSDEGQFSAQQPRLNVAFTDSALHVAVRWRNDPV